MHHNIKDLKPSANSRYKQGYIDPGSCKKLFPGLCHECIITRSSWERKFIYWCESNPNVKRWGSECITIPYILATDGSNHNYHPDFVVEMANGETWVVEIKPQSQCKRPLKEDGWLWNAYTHNMSKWVAAKKFCEDRGLKFKIFTEQTIAQLF